MRKKLIFFIALLLIVAGCSGAGSPVGDVQLRVLTEDYPPFNFVDKDGVVTGQSTEMVQAIMNEVGIESEIELLALAEALELAEKGSGVVLYSLNRTPEREELFKWVGPIGDYEQVFYARAGENLAELIKVPAIIIHANLFIALSKDVEDEVMKAWQKTLDRLKEERDDNDKTLIEKFEAKYKDPAYVESLIN